MKPDEVVLRFLESTARPEEAAQYLSLFRAERPESFATLAVSDTVMREDGGALATDLRYLSRLGLTPVVVLGLLSPSCAEADAETLRERLAGDVGVDVVAPERAQEIARAGRIPIVPLAAPAETDARWAVFGDLVDALAARKVIFVGRHPGLVPEGRRPPSIVDITTELDELLAPGMLPPRQAALLAQAAKLLERGGRRRTASVTSPLELLRELFTERGAGTLLRVGSHVHRFAAYTEVDHDRMVALIESAFGRPLVPGFFERVPDAIYVADDYRGAAIVEQTPLGGYLSKFAVGLAARGEGVARDLWRVMAADYPRLFWRSRTDNPIASWYTQLCDGLQRGPTWCVFWRGVETDEIPRIVAHAQAAQVDLEPTPV